MQFTTPCFVRVENPQERKELIEWMGQIGIAFHKMLLFAELPMIMSRAGHAMDFDCETDHLDDAVNCGTNISLFKALAAMNDENDREQWFVCIKSHACGCDDDGEYYHVGELSRFWDNRTPTANLWRKAAVEEIINHFKNQRS